MATNINEILARAAALRDETALDSIDPQRAGGIMYDTLIALNELWLQQGAALVISKIYTSVEAMEADSAPISDITNQPLRAGQIVVIASSDSDNGSIYRYDGTEDTTSSWSLVGAIGDLEVVDSLDSDSSILPLAARQGKVLDGKIEQLREDYGEYGENGDYIKVVVASGDKLIEAIDSTGQKIIFGNLDVKGSIVGLTRQVLPIIENLFPNKSTTDKFSEHDGELLWEGEPISGGTISPLVVDLPVSDGTDIEPGYAYIDSNDRTIKVKA